MALPLSHSRPIFSILLFAPADDSKFLVCENLFGNKSQNSDSENNKWNVFCLFFNANKRPNLFINYILFVKYIQS